MKRHDAILGLAAVALATIAAFALVGTCVPPLRANPVERMQARLLVRNTGIRGYFMACGTIDSIESFEGARYAARGDSCRLCIIVDGVTIDTAGVVPGQAEPILDANGTGNWEWLGRVQAVEFYRAIVERSPGDFASAGEYSGTLFDDPAAFVRIHYTNSVPDSITAVGAESLRYPVDGFSVDVGNSMTQSPVDTSLFYFGAPQRAHGLRYVLRTRSAWTSGAARWMRCEIVRDSALVGAVSH